MYKYPTCAVKKIFAAAIIVAIVSGLWVFSFADAQKQDFYDIEGHWSQMAVESLIEKNIVNGAPVDGVLEVMPDKSISRAEFVAIIVRAYDLKPVKDNIIAFNDNVEGAWYMDSLIAATSNSLIIGYPDGGFHPYDPLTNEQVSIILTRLRNQQIKDSGDEISDSWYVTEVLAKLREEILLVPADSFEPKNSATRAETFSALYSFIKAVDREDRKIDADDPRKNKNGDEPETTFIGGGGNIDITLTPSTGSGGSDGSAGGDNGSGSAGAGNNGTKPELSKTGITGFNISGKPGETIAYQIYAYLLDELGGFDFKITYDPNIAIATSVKSGSVKDGFYLDQSDADFSSAGEGVIYIRNNDKSELISSDGVLFTLVFRIRSDAAGSTVVSLDSSSSNEPILYKKDGSIIEPVTCTEGKITVK